MKINHHYLSFIVVLTIFIIVFSCSSDSDDDEPYYNNENNTNNTNNTPLNDTNSPHTSTPPVLAHTLTSDPVSDPTSNPLSDTKQLNLKPVWKNSQDICYPGWDIHPYKKCENKSLGVKAYKEARSSVCGIESHIKSCKRCSSPSFGIQNTNVVYENNFNKTTTITMQYSNVQSITFCENEKNKALSEFKTKYAPDNFITTINLTNSYLERIPDGFLSLFFAVEQAASYVPALRLVCDYHIKVEQITQFVTQESCEVCGNNEEIVYKVCRDPSHGIEEYNSKISKECGVNENIVTRSSNHLTKKEVEETEGVVLSCKTCNNISFDMSSIDNTINQKALIDKINCLLNNLNQLNLEDTARFFIISELRQLYYYSDLINENDPNLLDRMKSVI